MNRAMCDRCGEHYRQRGTTTCRRCAREEGDVRTTAELERDHLLARSRGQVAPRHVTVAPFVPFTRVVRGEWFDVMWDGSVR